MKDQSTQLFERALKVVPGGVHSPVRSFKGMDRSPIFFQSAEGAYLTDVEGKKYIDYCQSFGPLILGHRDPEVQEAVLSMIHKAWSFGAAEIYSLELAEWIKGKLPWIGKLRFVSSGTEAVMSALRVARGVTGKDKVLKFNGCYHGHVDSLLVKAGSGLAGEAEPSSAGLSRQTAQQTVIAELDSEEDFKKVFHENVKDLAAVIIEPLPANNGLMPQRIEFLKMVAEECRQNKVLLIFDEVISGFRVALGGMAELTGITPDLVTYGKILGGGFPVGCYAGKAEYMDVVAPLGPVYQAGTLSANPVGMCAGLATLQKIEKINVWKTLEEKTKLLGQLVTPSLEEHDLKFTQFGSLFWIHRKTNGVIRSQPQIPADQGASFKGLFLRSLEKGVYLAPNAYEVGFMSNAHTQNDIERTAQIINSSIK